MHQYRRTSFVAGRWNPGGPEEIPADRRRFRQALDFAVEWAKLDRSTVLWLVTSYVADLDRIADLNYFSDSGFSRLRRKRELPLGTFGAGPLLKHRALKQLGSLLGGTIIAFEPDQKLLDVLDSRMVKHDLIVIPGQRTPVDTWARDWGAVDIMANEQYPMFEIDDETARERIMEYVNAPQSSLKYPGDKEMGRRMFADLYQQGHRFTKDGIRATIMRETGLGPAQARAITRLSGRHARPAKHEPPQPQAS